MSKIGKLLAVVGGVAVGTGIGYLLFADKCKCTGCCGHDCDCDDEDDEFFDDLDDDCFDEEEKASETEKREYIEISN